MYFQTDFPRSYKSKKGNESKIANVYDRFLEYGEELARKLEQPASCRAYASCFDEQESWRKWPPERMENRKRSQKRHLHIYSHLENREIGEIRNLQGKRSVESSILSSECREFRFDQTYYTKRGGGAKKLRWENRRIIMKDVQKIVSYDTPKMALDLAPEYSGDPGDFVEQIMVVEPDERDYGTLFECQKYILVLRKSTLDVFCFENATRKPTKLLKKYILPYGWRYQKIGWNKINESIFVQANKRNGEKKRKEHSFLIFKAFPFEFETSFSIDSHAIPDWCSPIQNITIEEDLLQIITKNQAIFYAFPEICQKFAANLPRFSEERERIGLRVEIPIMFEIVELGEPLTYLMGSFLMIQCSSNMPLLVGFPIEKTHAFCIKNLENPQIPPIFPPNFPANRGGRDIMEFGIFSRLQHESCLIFPDFFTATFLVYEGCDLVKYCAGNGLKIAENAPDPLKIVEVWRTRIFPEVSDRNEYRKLEYNQRYRAEIQGKKQREKRANLRTPPFVEVKLCDYVKIHDTQFDDENVHINLSIDVAHVTPDGYFESTDYGNAITIQFQYVIDYQNGELLRIIPIYGQNSGAEPISIEQDLMIIQKTHQNSPNIEIWELIEPQQYCDFDEEKNGAKIGVKSGAKKHISRAEKRRSLFWESADFHLPDEDDDSDYVE